MEDLLIQLPRDVIECDSRPRYGACGSQPYRRSRSTTGGRRWPKNYVAGESGQIEQVVVLRDSTLCDQLVEPGTDAFVDGRLGAAIVEVTGREICE